MRKVTRVGEAFRPFVEEIERRRHPWLFTPIVEKKKGKGKGYHAPHVGRPGEVGGSRPRGAAGGDLSKKLKLTGEVKASAVKSLAAAWGRMPGWATDGVDHVSVDEGKGRSKNIGGKQYSVGGGWDVFASTITIHDANLYAGEEDDALYMLSHEVGHSVFNKWGLRGSDVYDVKDAHPEWFTKRGRVRARYKEDAYAAAPFYGSREKWAAALGRGEDGITPYSKSYKGHHHLGPETFAEMFRIRALEGQTFLHRKCKRARALGFYAAFEAKS